MSVKSSIVVLALASLLSGCGTYASLEHRNKYDPIVFGGSRMDINEIRYSVESNDWLEKQEIYNPYLDLPLSALADLLLLPYSIWYAVR